jgi:hypothetical protein
MSAWKPGAWKPGAWKGTAWAEASAPPPEPTPEMQLTGRKSIVIPIDLDDLRRKREEEEIFIL